MKASSFVIDFKQERREVFAQLDHLNSISVTQVIQWCVPPFNNVKVANELHYKYRDNEKNKYFRMKTEEILDLWEVKRQIAIRTGSGLDNYIEYLIEGKDLDQWKAYNNFAVDKKMQGSVEALEAFIKDVLSREELTLIGREVPFCWRDEDNVLFGRADMIIYNELTKMIIIIDWKTADDFTDSINRYTKYMLGPGKHIPDLKWHKATIQEQFYKFMIIQKYGINPDRIKTITVQLPSNGLYKVYQEAILYNEDLLKKLFYFSLKERSRNPYKYTPEKEIPKKVKIKREYAKRRAMEKRAKEKHLK